MTRLVLLPGMDGTGNLFDAFIDALDNDLAAQVVRYPTQAPLDYAALEAFVAKLLPVDEPYVLLGESFSGPIAVSLAASQPPQLKGVVLCCSFVKNPHPYFAGLKSILAALPLSWVPVHVAAHFVLGKFSSSARRTRLTAALKNVSTDALRARIGAVLGVDVTEKLCSVKVPLLYLRATQDHLIPRSASEWIEASLPTTRIVELKAPHFLLQVVPMEAAKLIGSFVRECCNPTHKLKPQ